MIIAHVAIPLILYRLFPLNLFALLLGSGAPNFDAIPTLLRKKTPKNAMAELHASSILHTPFFYMATVPVLWYFFGLSIAISFSLGGIIHISVECLDEKGRMLFYPLSSRFYKIYVFPYDFWSYVTNKKVLAFEGLLLVMAYIMFLF